MKVRLNEDVIITEALDNLIKISQNCFSTEIELKGDAKATSKVYLLTEDLERDSGYCGTIVSNYKTQLISNVQHIEIDGKADIVYVTSRIDAKHSATAAFCIPKGHTVVLKEYIIDAISNELTIIILIE